MASSTHTLSSSDSTERYRVLLDIGRRLTNTLSQNELYRVIHRECARILETTGFYICLYDEATDLARVVFYADQGEERETSVRYQGSVSEVIRTGEGQLIGDRSQIRSVLVLGEEHPEVTRSAISAPLRHDGKIMGAISAQSYQTNAYTAEDLELLQAIADLAAVAINNAKHVSELERRRREGEKIEDIGRALTSSLDDAEVLGKIADAVVELIRTDRATVWIMEDNTARVAESRGDLELESGLTWELEGRPRKVLAEDLEPLVIGEDVAGETLPEALVGHLSGNSAIAVPLVGDGELRGILTAGVRKGRSFTDDDVATMVRLASHASVALENAWLHSHVRELSLTDPLTGLPNRRHLVVHLERQIAAARRGRPLGVVLFDLDDFKRFNDTLGHVAGDEILRTVGKIFLDDTRAMNLAARFGGDEFVSVVSDTDREGVFAHAHRICKRMEADPRLSEYDISMSYGMAMFSEELDDPDALIEAADEALYRTKQARHEDERFPLTRPSE